MSNVEKVKTVPAAKREKAQKKGDKYYYASQWSLMMRKFRRHKLAMASTILLLIFYLAAIFGNFIAPQGTEQYDGGYVNCGPTPVHWFHEGKFIGPFVYGLKTERDPETYMLVFAEDTEQIYRIRFFAQGDEGGEYKLFGLIPSNLHLFEAEEGGKVFLFGTDSMGRDLFSRVVLGAQISLFIPVAGMLLTLVLGLFMGSLAGYFGGWVDTVISRVIDILLAFPSLLLAITVVAILGNGTQNTAIAIAIFSVPSIARMVRGIVMANKGAEYIQACQVMGASHSRIIFTHIIPNAVSQIIVNITLNLGTAILTASSLSFLGLGVQPPDPEWGAMLSTGRDVIRAYPLAVFIPGIAVTLVVMSFSLVGDGLRDALDPKLKNG